MTESRERPSTGADVRRVIEEWIREGRLRPRRFGPEFELLVEVIDEELRAQLARHSTGRVDLTRAEIHQLAFMIADQVDWVFDLARKPKAGDSAPPSRDIR